ncbi:hypothetical protein FM102_13650 [Corynebacterium glutamicum]|nr:hypothetical protein FM102_13650 [Corynebacterium glutamicum]
MRNRYREIELKNPGTQPKPTPNSTKPHPWNESRVWGFEKV